jgi:hypothetical protein
MKLHGHGTYPEETPTGFVTEKAAVGTHAWHLPLRHPDTSTGDIGVRTVLERGAVRADEEALGDYGLIYAGDAHWTWCGSTQVSGAGVLGDLCRPVLASRTRVGACVGDRRGNGAVPTCSEDVGSALRQSCRQSCAVSSERKTSW